MECVGSWMGEEGTMTQWPTILSNLLCSKGPCTEPHKGLGNICTMYTQYYVHSLLRAYSEVYTCSVRTCSRSIYVSISILPPPPESSLLCDGVPKWRGPHVPHTTLTQVQALQS